MVKPSAAARGYGHAHQQLRATFQRSMDAGQVYDCWRCGKRIDPTYWHLGHDDDDRSVYRGPECVKCNTSTAASRGNRSRGRRWVL